MLTRLLRHLLIVTGLSVMYIWPVQMLAESTQKILGTVQSHQDKMNHHAKMAMLGMLALVVIIAISSWRAKKKSPTQSKVGLIIAGILLIGLALTYGWIEKWY